MHAWRWGSCWLGGLGGALPVAALLGTWSQRQRSREVKTLEGGAQEQVGWREVAKGLRGGVVSSCALTQLCPNSWKSNPPPFSFRIMMERSWVAEIKPKEAKSAAEGNVQQSFFFSQSLKP